ncbi:MAG: Hsp20/alpha crystallin family protein [Candidatus Melainabacteria bacterium]|nr:Hsp20/alpha crystallin family protein [Candidatus Melainabacteria bacterium]
MKRALRIRRSALTPFYELDLVRQQLDRVLESPLQAALNDWMGGNGCPQTQESSDWAIPLELTETDTDYRMRLLLPDLSRDQIQLKATENRIQIEAHYPEAAPQEGETVHLREFRYGSLRRMVELPQPIQAQGIQARYEKGVLNLNIPKQQPHQEKTIHISIEET